MAEVSARDLRNHTREVLERVRRGERIQITVNRAPVAELKPLPPTPQFVPWAVIEEILQTAPADPELLDDIAFMREQRVEFPDD
jgi:prevent-host-death family protein